MFKKFMEKILGLESDPVSFDPSFLKDPVAKLTGWTPAKEGGTYLRTHKLVAINSNRLEFRACMGAILSYFVLMFFGISLLTGFYFFSLYSGEPFFNIVTIIGWFVGLTFAGAGGSLLYFRTVPIVFDKRTGYFWKGRKAPDEVIDQRPLKHFVELEQIHALQLISEYVSENKYSYNSYELNLVLEDGKRINVIDHGNRNKLREDAGTLSDFLEIPVWDAILLRYLTDQIRATSHDRM
ncbi:hypothetical protein ACFL1N_10185 [Thermodesulfobacteriota bacterium]